MFAFCIGRSSESNNEVAVPISVTAGAKSGVEKSCLYITLWVQIAQTQLKLHDWVHTWPLVRFINATSNAKGKDITERTNAKTVKINVTERRYIMTKVV
jgi:hypothetical protein